MPKRIYILAALSLALLFAFAGCSDSNNILSPAEDLTRDAVGEETVLAKPKGNPIGTLVLKPPGVQIPPGR